MRALVMSGGGVRGAYQVGVLRKLLADDGGDYDLLCGTSVGAINAAFLAQTPKGEPDALQKAFADLEALWLGVNNGRIKRHWLPFGVLSALWKPSIYNSRPLQKWIREQLDEKKVARSGRKLRVVSVSWKSGEVRVVSEGEPHLHRWVAASSAFPVMLSPVHIHDEPWADGGMRNVTPLGQAIDAGADEIDVLMCWDPFARVPFDPRHKAALPGLAVRALDVLADQIMRADIQICGLKNHLAKLDATAHRHVRVRLFSPRTPIDQDPLDFDPAAIRRMIKQGYEEACGEHERDMDRLMDLGGAPRSRPDGA